MTNENNSNGLQAIVSQALATLKEKNGKNFDLQTVNLAELQRMTGISRSRLRRLKKNNFQVQPHGRTGIHASNTVLTGFTGILDLLLQKGVTNSQVCFDRVCEAGYNGGLTQVKMYIQQHHDLVPAKRILVVPQGPRSFRYKTEPGEVYQMDWGFAKANMQSGKIEQIACFAMICHHCGEIFVEFFPNAKQENLFIGMLHGFREMCIPQRIVTDNMKSVVIGRAPDGFPIWQKDYEQFMTTFQFQTTLCQAYHPYTKGAVERLVRFVKENFLPGRVFTDLTDLNNQVTAWCCQKNSSYRKASDCIPDQQHNASCVKNARMLPESPEVYRYLAPERTISFDGFISYEGRRFGVPIRYNGKTCRVMREGSSLSIYDTEMKEELIRYDVTWSRQDSFCEDQFSDDPEEKPTAPVKVEIQQIEKPEHDEWFDQFKLEGGKWHD